MTYDTYRPRGNYTNQAHRYRGKQRCFSFSLKDLEPHINTILAMDDLASREAAKWSPVVSEAERLAIIAAIDCLRGKLFDLRRQGRI